MKVKKLIELLDKCDPEAPVMFEKPQGKSKVLHEVNCIEDLSYFGWDCILLCSGSKKEEEDKLKAGSVKE